MRSRVLLVCEGLLKSNPAPMGADEYWVKASMAEAYVGLDNAPKAQELLEAARAVDMSVPSLESISKTTTEPLPSAVPKWMSQTTADQLARLRGLLAKSPLNRVK